MVSPSFCSLKYAKIYKTSVFIGGNIRFVRPYFSLDQQDYYLADYLADLSGPFSRSCRAGSIAQRFYMRISKARHEGAPLDPLRVKAQLR